VKNTKSSSGINTSLLRKYMMGAADPGFSNKVSGCAVGAVDLHLEASFTTRNSMDATAALLHQLDFAERKIDEAVTAGKQEIRLIHGLGKGTLKKELHKMLAKHPMVSSFENDYHGQYGFGSTLVQLKW
jgi:dsDNA-specific endonuclease/ATPase MutS2